VVPPGLRAGRFVALIAKVTSNVASVTATGTSSARRAQEAKRTLPGTRTSGPRGPSA
jgi:hypothetical protein